MTELTLRDYQITDIARLRETYAQGAKAPIYQLATGGGKTVVFSHIVQGATAKGKRTGVFVHRRELINQASAKLALNAVPHGIMAAGLDRNHDEPVQVLSIQSAINRELPQFDFIVIDEAHHTRADTWHKLLAAQDKAKLLGVTATPARTDGKGLGTHCGGLFDAMICGPSIADLTKAGHLAPTKCLVPPVQIDLNGLRKVAGDYHQGELAERASLITGDVVREYAKHAAGRSAIVFCVTVAHAERVAEAFAAAGLRAACVHGGTPKDIRDGLIEGLGNGGLDILTSCDLISEGLDIPSVGAVIMLRSTSSLIMCKQQVGRGMRPKADGSALIVIDHAGNLDRHGLPDEDCMWTLDGVERPLVQRAAPNPDTVGFGKPREIIEVDGELVEVTAEQAAIHRWAKMGLGQFKKHPRTPTQIRAFGKAHGYKAGWAFYYAREQAERFRVAA